MNINAHLNQLFSQGWNPILKYNRKNSSHRRRNIKRTEAEVQAFERRLNIDTGTTREYKLVYQPVHLQKLNLVHEPFKNEVRGAVHFYCSFIWFR